MAIVAVAIVACCIDHVRHGRDARRAPLRARVAFAGVVSAVKPAIAAHRIDVDRSTTGETGVLRAAGVREVRLEERAPDELVAQALGAGPVADRTAALDALAYAVPPGSDKAGYVGSTLRLALADPDERIRAQALVTLREAVLEVPAHAVAQVARDDPAPQLRIEALELLVERQGEASLESLYLALADPEPVVQRRARELVEDLHPTPGGL